MGNITKKITGLVIISSFLFCSNLSAQLSFGLKGGVNLSSLNVSVGGIDMSTTKAKNFVMGGFLNYAINNEVSIQPEVLYQVMGANIDSVSIKANYLSIPILLKIDVNSLLFVEAGPQLGILMSATSGKENIKKDLKTTDFQFVFGGGLRLTSKLQAGFRLGYGLLGITKNTTGSIFGQDVSTSVKNNALSVGLSYGF